MAKQLALVGNICFKDIRLRFAYHGCNNRPFFHIVASHKKADREGEFYEQLGSYDPLPNKNNEKLVAINLDRIGWWIGKGAEPSKPVSELLGLSGYLPVHPMSVVNAKRARDKMTAVDMDSSPESSQAET